MEVRPAWAHAKVRARPREVRPGASALGLRPGASTLGFVPSNDIFSSATVFLFCSCYVSGVAEGLRKSHLLLRMEYVTMQLSVCSIFLAWSHLAIVLLTLG